MSVPVSTLLNSATEDERKTPPPPPNDDVRPETAASLTSVYNADNQTDLAESSGDETRAAIESEIASAKPRREIPEEGVSEQDISKIAEILRKDTRTVGRTIRLAIHKDKTGLRWTDFTKDEYGFDGGSTARLVQKWVKLPEWPLVVKYMNKDGRNATVMAHFPTLERQRKVTRQSPSKS